jgi:hypothetical protein
MDFWHVHGLIFLVCVTLFPRLTMLFAVSAPFGPLAWIGWLFFPHVTVAVLATTYYWHTNPILCILAWLVAFGGTAGEGKIASRRSKKRKK